MVFGFTDDSTPKFRTVTILVLISRVGWFPFVASSPGTGFCDGSKMISIKFCFELVPSYTIVGFASVPRP